VNRPNRPVTALLAAGILFATAAQAQSPSARVSGNALDQVGGLLPYAKVELTNRRTMAHHEVRTDQSGHFEIEGVAPGDYVLQAERSGFTNAQESLSLGPGEHLHHEITLSVAPFEEHVIVDGDAERDPGAKLQTAAVSPKCEPSAIGGDLEGPVRLRGAPPGYPPRLRELGIKGTVVIGGRISADGLLAEARVLKAAHADLATASIAAIEGWRWTTPRLDCVPIEASLTITVEFRLAR
jgi:TonB family protein